MTFSVSSQSMSSWSRRYVFDPRVRLGSSAWRAACNAFAKLLRADAALTSRQSISMICSRWSIWAGSVATSFSSVLADRRCSQALSGTMPWGPSTRKLPSSPTCSRPARDSESARFRSVSWERGFTATPKSRRTPRPAPWLTRGNQPEARRRMCRTGSSRQRRSLRAFAGPSSSTDS